MGFFHIEYDIKQRKMEVIRAELLALQEKVDTIEREMRNTTTKPLHTNIIEKTCMTNDTTVTPTKIVTAKIAKGTDMIFPWTGIVNEVNCRGLRVNHGLYTQCENKIHQDTTKLCKTCHGQSVKNGSDKPNSGTVDDRMKEAIMDYIDKKTGKRCIGWLTVLQKLNITKEDALDAAERAGITIPECQLTEETTKKRGRPKKPTESEEGGVGDVSPKKSRGRPKKEKKALESLAGDDLIANMIATMAPQAVVSGDVIVEDSDSKSNEDDELEEESVTEVNMLIVKGIQYLLDEDNTVYDVNTQDEIGTYDEESDTITPK